MKIGILTQPLHTNYGGLLQAFALQKVLRDMGHEVLTIDYTKKAKWWTFPYRFGRRIIGKFLLGRGGPLFPRNYIIPEIRVHTDRFIRENIKTTHKIYAPASAKDFAKYHFDAFVVGSDQTWRPDYSPCMPTFFLDFLGEDKMTKRIAYAASFGKREWTFSPSLTKKCAVLAKKFDAISVREDSGIALCEKYLGVSAEHVLDPTMLLDKEDYCKLIEADEARGLLPPKSKEKTLFAYILDRTPEKMSIVQKVAQERNLKIVEVMPKATDYLSPLKDRVFPPVTAFLRGFRDADCVITDSFHGTVFSIIFNKPVGVIENSSRGSARFLSLLNMFQLEKCLIHSTEKPSFYEIDWNGVNAIRIKNREFAFHFLKDSLIPEALVTAKNNSCN